MSCLDVDGDPLMVLVVYMTKKRTTRNHPGRPRLLTAQRLLDQGDELVLDVPPDVRHALASRQVDVLLDRHAVPVVIVPLAAGSALRVLLDEQLDGRGPVGRCLSDLGGDDGLDLGDGDAGSHAGGLESERGCGDDDSGHYLILFHVSDGPATMTSAVLTKASIPRPAPKVKPPLYHPVYERLAETHSGVLVVLVVGPSPKFPQKIANSHLQQTKSNSTSDVGCNSPREYEAPPPSVCLAKIYNSLLESDVDEQRWVGASACSQQ